MRDIITSERKLAIARRLLPKLQKIMLPARAYGLCGTPDRPLVYQAGAAVPWWILAIYPRTSLRAVFAVQIKTWFEDGNQCVQATSTEPQNRLVHLVTPAGITAHGVQAQGAPTNWIITTSCDDVITKSPIYAWTWNSKMTNNDPRFEDAAWEIMNGRRDPRRRRKLTPVWWLLLYAAPLLAVAAWSWWWLLLYVPIVVATVTSFTGSIRDALDLLTLDE